MSDSLADGRRYRLFNVIETILTKSLAIGVNTSLPSLRVIKLERLINHRGSPASIRCDNGRIYLLESLSNGASDNGKQITLRILSTGQADAECFYRKKNGNYTKGFTGHICSMALSEVREKCEEWGSYNTERPHKSLGYLSYKISGNGLLALSTPASGNSSPVQRSR